MTDFEYVIGLLELSNAPDTDALLESALRLLVARTDAPYGYIEVEAEPTTAVERRVWRAHGCSDAHVASIQARTSRTIVRKALGQGHTVSSASAVDDPRFKHADSVRQFEIGAVVCVPFGNRLCGVIYLQGAGIGERFVTNATSRAEQAARLMTQLLERRRFHIGPRLSAREQANLERQELIVEALAVHGRNLSAIEKATGISRTQLRRMLNNRDDE